MLKFVSFIFRDCQRFCPGWIAWSIVHAMITVRFIVFPLDLSGARGKIVKICAKPALLGTALNVPSTKVYCESPKLLINYTLPKITTALCRHHAHHPLLQHLKKKSSIRQWVHPTMSISRPFTCWKYFCQSFKISWHIVCSWTNWVVWYKTVGTPWISEISVNSL